MQRENSDGETPVQVACCFPWTHPREFISLRDDKGKEQLLIDDLQQAAAPARDLIEDVSNDLYLIPNPKGLDAKSLKLLWVYLD